MPDAGATLPYWLRVLDALGSFLGGIGLLATAVGLFFLAKQTRANEQAATAAAYQSIVAAGNSINDMFIKESAIHAKLFESNIDNQLKHPIMSIENDNPREFYAAIKVLDHFEIILVSWKVIPKHLRPAWKNVMENYFRNSKLLTRIVSTTNWYGQDMVKICEDAHKPISEKKSARSSINLRLAQIWAALVGWSRPDGWRRLP